MNRKSLIFAFTVIITVIISGFVYAASLKGGPAPVIPILKVDKNTKEPVVINGDTVEYSETDMTAVANGNVVITYQDTKLTCKKAIFHTDTKEILAEGDVNLMQGKDFLKGESMVYNVETKTGTLVSPRVFIAPTYYGGGEKAEKQDLNHYYMKNGYVTTCDKEKPHYRVQAKQLNVYLNDRVTANNILVFVGDVPVFYFPYLSIPLNDHRPPVTVQPGHNDDWGYFLLTSWKYYLNENIKGRINIDYREFRNFAYGVSTNYHTDNYGSGVVNLNYFNELNQHSWSSRPDQPDEKLDRYRAQLRHKWQPDPATSAIVEYNKLSDINVVKDYYIRNYQRDMVNNNYASIVRTDPYYTTSLLVQPRVNRFDSVIEYLPQAQFQTRSLKIGQTNFYYDGSAQAANINNLQAAPVNGVAAVNRVDTNNQLSYQANVLGWLGIKPFVGTEQTYYSRDRLGDNDNFIRGNAFTGVDLNTRFYKTFDVKSNALNIDINGLRHVVSPTISYYYAHRPTFRPENLGQFDSIDTINYSNNITPSLENKLQTKRLIAGKMQTVDLARLILSTNYNFETADKKKGKVGTYDYLFESKQYNWMRILSTASYDQHASRFSAFTFNIVGDPNNLENQDLRGAEYTDLTLKKWSWGAGYRWQNNVYSQLEGQVMFNVTEKWKVTAYEMLNFRSTTTGVNAGNSFFNRFTEQEYRVSRDLHCWIGDLIFNVSQDHGYTFMFSLRLKAFPEMPFEFQKNYNPPMFGSTLPPN